MILEHEEEYSGKKFCERYAYHNCPIFLAINDQMCSREEEVAGVWGSHMLPKSVFSGDNCDKELIKLDVHIVTTVHLMRISNTIEDCIHNYYVSEQNYFK